MELEPDAALNDNKNSFIRSLRYCRDHRGLLAVLSRTGQLKIFDTTTEYSSLDIDVEGSPKLLHVRKSNEMDTRYSDYSRKNDRIVSFDWVTMGSPVLQPRLLVLRANGAFEILEKPSHTMTYAYKLVPWMAPYRGLEGPRYASNPKPVYRKETPKKYTDFMAGRGHRVPRTDGV